MLSTDVYVSVLFVDEPGDTSDRRTFLLFGKYVELDGHYETVDMTAVDSDKNKYTKKMRVFVA